jgi:HEAT repeat protein
VNGLSSPQVAERLAALAAIVERGSIDAGELRAVTACLGHETKVVQRRAAEALAALQQRGVDVEEMLLATLESPLPSQRWGAAFALSLFRTPPAEALPVLLQSLGDDDGDVRWAAANILVRMHAQPPLVDALCVLLGAGSAAQRKMAAYCLRDLGVSSAAVDRALHAALDDQNTAVRIAAMASLTRLARDRAAVAQRLIGMLDDADAGVRRAAAAALGSLGERAASVLSALRALAASPDASLQRAAQRSLRLLDA